MIRSEYMETVEGQRRALSKRRLQRQLFLVVPHEPIAKGNVTEQIRDFQRSLTRQMESFGRRAFRSQVVLEIDFFSQQNDPPAVHTLAKNYMDLLQRPVESSGIRRRHVLLTDDRHIDVLIVNYHLRQIPEPEIRLRVDTMANFSLDLELLRRIRDNDFSDADHRSDFRWDEATEEHREQSLEDAMRSLRDWELRRTSIVANWGASAFESMHYMNVYQAQEAYLRTFEPKVRDLFMVMAPFITHISGMERMNAMMRDMVITPPLMLDLAHAPVPEVGKAAFKTNVENALTAFKTKHPLLFPLRTTLGVTLFCVPPKDHSTPGKEQYVDLDNLARYVIPVVHEVLQPPSNDVHAFDVPARLSSTASSWHAERLASLKRTPKYSVVQYQFVRLPRLPNDPDKGLVRLALQRGDRGTGLWRQMDRRIDQWKAS